MYIETINMCNSSFELFQRLLLFTIKSKSDLHDDPLSFFNACKIDSIMHLKIFKRQWVMKVTKWDKREWMFRNYERKLIEIINLLKMRNLILFSFFCRTSHFSFLTSSREMTQDELEQRIVLFLREIGDSLEVDLNPPSKTSRSVSSRRFSPSQSPLLLLLLLSFF